MKAIGLLRVFCPDHMLEEIEGDLLQKFEKDEKRFGRKRAGRRLWWNVVRFVRPEILFRNRFRFKIIQNVMIGNYIKIALRNFSRQKAYTFLNITGLSLGMAASLLIIQYVNYERSFDTFHSRARDIYRIQYNGWQNGQLNFESAVAVPAAAAALKNNFEEVEAFTRFLPFGGIFKYEKPGDNPIGFREKRGQLADSSIFKVFDFKLTAGDQRTCLKGINKILISESTAHKYFGDEDPLGKRLHRNAERELYEVTGVFEDVPENSHIKFDLLVSYETINARTRNESENSWGWYDFYSYVLLRPNTDVAALQAKWNDFLAKERSDNWKKFNTRQEFLLKPMTDIHLYSRLLYETSPEEQRDGDSVYALSIIALFILVIAWVNYINLATARSFNRANEVGVRKVVGAFRRQLISQFLIESVMLNVFAAFLAIAIVRISWTSFSELTGWHIPLASIMLPGFWIMVVALFLVGAFLSGFYPAIILSSFRPVSVLKGKIVRSSGGNYLRKGLVVFQFVASVFLISGSMIVYHQLSFMKNKDLGIRLDQTLVMRGPRVTDSLYLKNYESFKTELLRIPGVKSITASSNIPGDENYWTQGVRRLTGGPEGSNTVTTMALDYDFIPQYGIKILAGRNFDRAFPSDEQKVMINQMLSKQLEFADPTLAIGERLITGRDTLEIGGVIEDFHQMSLKSEIIPLMCLLTESSSYYSIKLETDNYKNVMESVDGPWKSFFPGNPMEYFFLDQFYNRQYERDDRFGQVFTIFTGLAIFIASLGLVGLASFMTVMRIREIGIRKVLGSTVTNIVLLLSRGFMLPVLIAIIIACPLGWWLMSKWLQSFPYRTTISPWVFVVSGLLVLLIAFISVSSQTLKAALTKPAETLKYE